MGFSWRPRPRYRGAALAYFVRLSRIGTLFAAVVTTPVSSTASFRSSAAEYSLDDDETAFVPAEDAPTVDEILSSALEQEESAVINSSVRNADSAFLADELESEEESVAATEEYAFDANGAVSGRHRRVDTAEQGVPDGVECNPCGTEIEGVTDG